MRLLLSLCATTLLLATPASGAAPNFLLGVRGDVARFQAQTGQDSQVRHSLVGWGQGLTWGTPLPALLEQHAPIPLIGITTDTKPPRREAITPAGIAAGRGDAYLVGWNQANIPANRPEAFYPGDAYVDVVGNDVYDFNRRPAWPENDRLYRLYPKKPYAFPEWGVWESDNPEFIRTMARFVRTHQRVELLVYNPGKPGSPSDLGPRPRSRAAYRAAITPLGR